MIKLLVIFITIFLAELGDKTQISAILLASDKANNPWMIFLISSLALIASTGLAILIGYFGRNYLENIPIKLIAGSGFCLIGIITIITHFKS